MARVLRTIWFGAAGAAALLLAACGGDAPPAPSPEETSEASVAPSAPPTPPGPEPSVREAVFDPDDVGPLLASRDADAPRAEPEAPDAFEYVRYLIDVEEETPRACLGFTRPLDPAVDYAPYLRLEPAAPIALSVSGQQLCIGGLGFSESRELTLLAGLPAADGSALEREETATLDFGDRPAYVGFSGSGVILPRVEADGVAIETVNVDTVEIAVRRITDRALAFRTIGEGYEASAGDYAWLDYGQDPYEVSRLIWEGEMDTAGPRNVAVTTVFPIAEAIETLEPGAYFLEIDQVSDEDNEHRRARARRWLVITDLAITAYEGSDGLDFMVRSLQSAQPMDDVTVQLVAASNELLGEAVTDADGRARFDAPLLAGPGAARARLLMAYAENGDFAVLDLDRAPVDLSSEDISGRAPPSVADGYIYFDRGIYRPGETVHASALVRDARARALSGRAGALVVYRPNGIEARRARFDSAQNAGSVFLDYETPRSAARGQWRMALELDGVGTIASASFQVEDFVPQRIELTLEADDETPIVPGAPRPVQADVRFLYGAPGAGLPVEAEARIEVDPQPFPDLEGFRIGLHDEAFSEVAFDLPATAADGAGHAVLMLDPTGRADADRPLRVRAVVSAIEPGGRAVRDDVRIPFRPRELYVGVRPDFEYSNRRNEPAQFDVAAISRDGALAGEPLEWRLTRIDYEYDWYRTSGGAWRWRRSREIVPIEDGVVETTAGETARIVTRELDWGDYRLVVSAEDGSESSVGFWVGWGSRSQDGVEAPDRVRVTTPETAPRVGDTAEITVLAPYEGEAEIVIANERVIETRSITVPADGARLSLPVTEDWGSGAYVMVSVFTPRDPVARPRPRRAVGVAHIPVSVEDRTFGLSIEAPELARPREPLTVTLAAASGPVDEDAYVTLAAVDEGILLLTRFQSPDPTEHFFGRRRLGVSLHDDYGRLLDPNQGAAAPVRVGGDQIGGAGLTVVPTRSVVMFSGPVALDDDGRADITLDVPDFNGELRLMAVAWSQSGLGAASQPITVRDPVTAELILPRFLAPGDAAAITASIDNVEGPAGRYEATVSATWPITVDGDGVIAADFEAGQRRDLTADIATDAEAISRVALALSGPDGFTVERDYPIQIRSPYLPASYVDRARVQPGETYTPPADALASFMPGSGAVSVSFATSPVDAAALYASLDRYPYGCTEQIVSRATPLLYADHVAALAGVTGADTPAQRINEAVQDLLNRQSEDGAIGLWRIGDRDASPWLGAYAVDFLSRAHAEGYEVPEAALERAYGVMRNVAAQNLYLAAGYDREVRTSQWNPDTAERLRLRSAAYAFYVLARAGRADRAALRYMHDEQLSSIESPLARAHLAAALSFIGDRARSHNAFALAEAAIGYRNDGDYYQTPRRDMAGVLALAAEAGESDLVARLAERVGDELPEPNRLTTQEKAHLLLAAYAMSGSREGPRVAMEGAAEEVAEGLNYGLDAEALAAGASFTNTGDLPVWRTTISRGAPASAPPPVEEGIAVVKDIRTTGGQPASLAALAQGDRLIVSLTVFPRERRTTPVVVADLLPAGFEIETVLQPSDAGPNGPYAWLGELRTPDIAEARDDQYVASMNLYDQQPASLAYIVRAVTPGRFAMPGAVVEDMYRPDVFGRSAAGEVIIAPRS